MIIRAAAFTDIPQIATLVRSLAHYYLDNSDTDLPSWLEKTLTEEQFNGRISSPDYDNFILEEYCSLVGYISVKRTGHLYHLFVSEDYQGKGFSRLLWEHVLKNSDSKTFTLRSSVYAIPVYKRFGFSESGSLATKDGVSFQPMELRLPSE